MIGGVGGLVRMGELGIGLLQRPAALNGALNERSRQILGNSSGFSRSGGKEQEDRDVNQQASEGRRVHC